MNEEVVEYCDTKWKRKILISTATEGLIRFEWAHKRYGQMIPVNWESTSFDLNLTMCGYWIDDAYNMITKKALDMGVEWLILVEDDVLIPVDTFLKFTKYMEEGEEAVVSGLYYTKSSPSQPLIFRGRGTGPYLKWKLGDKVRADGLPMGCLLIHVPVLAYMWENSEPYTMLNGTESRRVFETPKRAWFDPETGKTHSEQGTQDLYFFNRMMEQKALKATGWDKLARKKYPLLCDTSIFCQHIDRSTGQQFP